MLEFGWNDWKNHWQHHIQLSQDYRPSSISFHQPLWNLTLCPRYDDRPVRQPGTVIWDRGAKYRRQWKEATLFQPTPCFVLITSWNEWHEGTSIEPTHISSLMLRITQTRGKNSK